jgi:competence protein ComEA
MADAPVPPRPEIRSRPWPTVLDRLAAWRDDPRVGVVALAVAALVAGFVWFQLGRPGSAGGSSAGASPTVASRVARRAVTSTTGGAGALVHVAGAVVHPGVVRLHTGDRVMDAIQAAGGAATGADLDRLNLAAKVTDGQRLAVPKVGEPAPATVGDGSATTPAGVDDQGSPGPVDLNTATQAQLESLPGIGPSLATAIIRERERRGGFKRVDELRDVRGIGDKRFEDLKPLVAV